MYLKPGIQFCQLRFCTNFCSLVTAASISTSAVKLLQLITRQSVLSAKVILGNFTIRIQFQQPCCCFNKIEFKVNSATLLLLGLIFSLCALESVLSICNTATLAIIFLILLISISSVDITQTWVIKPIKFENFCGLVVAKILSQFEY